MASTSSFLLSLAIGVLASAIVAWVVAIVSRRRSRFHLRALKQSESIYSVRKDGDIVIQVQYKGKEVKSSLIVLRLIVENDGKQDIRYDTHFSGGVCISNKYFTFIEASAKESESKPVCVIKDEGKVFLTWDILKTGEKIELELVSKPNEKTEVRAIKRSIYDDLSFDLRADCLDTIKIDDETPPVVVRLISNKLIASFVGTMMWIVLLFSFFSMNLRYKTNILQVNNQPVGIMYSALFDKYIVMEDYGAPVVISPKDMPLDVTIALHEGKSFEHVLSSIIEVLLILLIVLSIISGVIYIIITRDKRKHKKTRTDSEE